MFDDYEELDDLDSPLLLAPDSPAGGWRAEVVRTGTGELPVVRHAISWQTAPLALRYVLEMRRRLASPASLIAHVRELVASYLWAESEGFFLEDRVVAGPLLRKAELLRLKAHLLHEHAEGEEAAAEVPAGTFARRLNALMVANRTLLYALHKATSRAAVTLRLPTTRR